MEIIILPDECHILHNNGFGIIVKNKPFEILDMTPDYDWEEWHVKENHREMCECIECGKKDYSVLRYGGYCRNCYETIIHENPL